MEFKICLFQAMWLSMIETQLNIEINLKDMANLQNLIKKNQVHHIITSNVTTNCMILKSIPTGTILNWFQALCIEKKVLLVLHSLLKEYILHSTLFTLTDVRT